MYFSTLGTMYHYFAHLPKSYLQEPYPVLYDVHKRTGSCPGPSNGDALGMAVKLMLKEKWNGLGGESSLGILRGLGEQTEVTVLL